MSNWSDKIIVIGVGNVDTEKVKEAIIEKLEEAK